LLWLYS